MRRLVTTVFFALLLVAGCVTEIYQPPHPLPSTRWPALGWDTNTPSLAPVTNVIEAPVFQDLP